MSVNDKVRALRELNNWSQEEVAERMQINACRLTHADFRKQLFAIGKG